MNIEVNQDLVPLLQASLERVKAKRGTAIIKIDESTYTAVMALVREARLNPPLIACPAGSWRKVEDKLRIAMMQTITDEVQQLTDGIST